MGPGLYEYRGMVLSGYYTLNEWVGRYGYVGSRLRYGARREIVAACAGTHYSYMGSTLYLAHLDYRVGGSFDSGRRGERPVLANVLRRMCFLPERGGSMG